MLFDMYTLWVIYSSKELFDNFDFCVNDHMCSFLKVGECSAIFAPYQNKQLVTDFAADWAQLYKLC